MLKILKWLTVEAYLFLFTETISHSVSEEWGEFSICQCGLSGGSDDAQLDFSPHGVSVQKKTNEPLEKLPLVIIFCMHLYTTRMKVPISSARNSRIRGYEARLKAFCTRRLLEGAILLILHTTLCRKTGSSKVSTELVDCLWRRYFLFFEKKNVSSLRREMKITIEYLVDARTKDRNTLLDPDNVLTLTVRGDQTYLLLALILYLIDKSYLNADCMKCRFFLVCWFGWKPSNQYQVVRKLFASSYLKYVCILFRLFSPVPAI